MSTNISDLNISGLKFYEPTQAGAPKALDGTSTSDLQNNFLRLLTVQLQNQDPLNPLESAEMTSQLAQLNMVDGINNMNKSMASLVEQLRVSDFMNQSNTVGRQALVAASTMEFDGANAMSLGALFSQPVTDAVAKITDNSGNVIRTINLGTVGTDVRNFYWDGMNREGQAAQAGQYRIEITGVNNGNTVAAQSMVGSMVAAVGRSGSDINLTLLDGRKVRPSEIVQWVY